MLVQCGIEKNRKAALKESKKTIDSGAALERFRLNIELQGGDATICDKPEKLIDSTLIKVPVTSKSAGYVSDVDTFAVGRAVCDLGGGRVKAEDGVDHAVGFSSELKIGDKVKRGGEIGVIYCRTADQADSVSGLLQTAYRITSSVPKVPKLIRASI
jgi:thymidine phosphorylase